MHVNMVWWGYIRFLLCLCMMVGLEARGLERGLSRDGEMRPTLSTREELARDGEMRPTLPTRGVLARDGEMRPTLPTREELARDGEMRPTLPTREELARDGEMRPTLPTREELARDGEMRPTLPTREKSVADNLDPMAAIIQDRINRETSSNLYEGDIALTKEQQRIIQQRKGIPTASSYWPKDTTGTVTVGYRFGDGVIDQSLVKQAISHWEEHTCINFEEISTTVGGHLIFEDAAYCASYVGKISSLSGQSVWLHSSCVAAIGPAIHEIGHALGFFHEQARSDRDDHVKVLFDNIKPDMTNNFEKRESLNHGVPYDYLSVMHYGSDYFSSNGKMTLAALNPMAQPLMGNRKGLSFADKRLANILYGCLDKWVGKCGMTVDPCRNLGYIGVSCGCVCPEGTSGTRCETKQDSYVDALIKLRNPHSETITTEGTISTPGYPTPIQTETKFVKMLVAPACHRVRLIFNDFHIYGRTQDESCGIDGLDIRVNDQIGADTPYCGSEISANQVFESEFDTIVLNYYNYDYASVSGYVSSFRGFTATVEFFLADGCTSTTTTTPSPPTTTTTTSTTTPTPPPTTTTTSTTTPPPTTTTTTSTTTTSPTTTTTTSTTTTTTAPPTPTIASSTSLVTTINSGVINLTLSASSTGSCFLESYPFPPYYRLFSSRHPEPYREGDECNVVLETSEPRYLKVMAPHVHLTNFENLAIGDVFDYEVRISDELSNPIEMLISASTITFKTQTTASRGGFELDIQVINSQCHQVIQVQEGGSGILEITDYTKDTICEWWIQAPAGKEIELVFSSYDVGTFDCWSDFLAIDVQGDRYYKADSSYYCGDESPGTVTSSGGQINVLLSGLEGGYPGFSATYSVKG